jgi:hypothetical protein
VYFVWAILIVFGITVFSALVLIAAALFTPVVLTIDSENGRASLRWFAVLEYRRPMPWADGQAGWSIAGKPVRMGAGKPKKKRKEKEAERKPRKNRAKAVRFLRRCLGEPAIRRVLSTRLRELGKGVLRSIALTGQRIRLSLPDPAWNGMLIGWQAWRGSRSSAVRFDFSGENSVFLEVRLYPYRIVRALLLFSFGLPYRALWREWRAAAELVSG